MVDEPGKEVSPRSVVGAKKESEESTRCRIEGQRENEDAYSERARHGEEQGEENGLTDVQVATSEKEGEVDIKECGAERVGENRAREVAYLGSVKEVAHTSEAQTQGKAVVGARRIEKVLNEHGHGSIGEQVDEENKASEARMKLVLKPGEGSCGGKYWNGRRFSPHV